MNILRKSKSILIIGVGVAMVLCSSGVMAMEALQERIRQLEMTVGELVNLVPELEQARPRAGQPQVEVREQALRKIRLLKIERDELAVFPVATLVGIIKRDSDVAEANRRLQDAILTYAKLLIPELTHVDHTVGKQILDATPDEYKQLIGSLLQEFGHLPSTRE